jgi:sugar (pentulose or hexulose) kinase
MPLPVILIFDIGKTNKKVLLFDKQYQLVYETSEQLKETTDEDGFPCEDVEALTAWVKESFRNIQNDNRFEITAVNVSAYGASLVSLNYHHQPFLPLYNYLKPYDEELQRQFYSTYGGEEKVAKETASPVLGHLNSGMQLYWLKYKKPEQYAQISYALHLPQYISFVLCGMQYSDITSIGCHTNLWNFKEGDYHNWVYEEGINKKLAPVISCTEVAGVINDHIPVGCGLHDSSAALIPYFTSFNEPFILLSTGTWSISINPFNHSLLTTEELKQDCLSFLSYQGDAVKASRLFAGYEHEQQVKRIAAHYNTSAEYFKTMLYDASICNNLHRVQPQETMEGSSAMVGQSPFGKRNLHDFETCEEAYHQLILDIIKQQVQSTKLVMNGKPVRKIFVDGGFSKNDVYMHLLAAAFPHIEVYSAKIAQASALGAAIAIRRAWNGEPLPDNLITVKRYQPTYDIVL